MTVFIQLTISKSVVILKKDIEELTFLINIASLKSDKTKLYLHFSLIAELKRKPFTQKIGSCLWFNLRAF